METRDGSFEIRQYVDRVPVTVDVTAPLGEALSLMAEQRIGAVLVTEKGRLAGIFTERDLITLLPAQGPSLLDRRMGELMTPDPVTVDVTDDFSDVYTKMRSLHVRHLPILDGLRLVGMVSIRDITNTYQNILISQYEDARHRADELESMVGLSTDDRFRRLASDLEKYKRLSLTDPLTGLYNKRYFTARLTEEIARARRTGTALSIIFVDLDHFKLVNDRYGHGRGDVVLQQLAAILSNSLNTVGVVSRLRKSDIVARYGGEEFVAILPDTPLAGALVTGEKLRSAVEDECFEGGIRMSASFGVAELSGSIEDADQLIRQADEALYRAKHNGRNRVEAFADQEKGGGRLVD